MAWNFMKCVGHLDKSWMFKSANFAFVLLTFCFFFNFKQTMQFNGLKILIKHMHFMFLRWSEIKRFVLTLCLSHLHVLLLCKRIGTCYPQVSDSGWLEHGGGEFLSCFIPISIMRSSCSTWWSEDEGSPYSLHPGNIYLIATATFEM